MPIFVTLAALLLLLSLAAIVLPLLKSKMTGSVVERNEANLQILRDQLVELDADLRNGTLLQEQYQTARAELERRVLEESQQGGSTNKPERASHRWLAPVVIAILVPAVSLGLYTHLGDTDALDVDSWMQQQAGEITPEDIARMMQQLEQHLADNPDDAEGWAMLGRSRRALHEFDAAARAWKRAAELQPDDADVLTDYAESLGLAAQGDLTGEPTRLLTRALKLDSDNPKALALSGSAAFARTDYAAAIAYWEKLLALSADDHELAQALTTGITEARARLGQGASDAAAADSKPSSAKADSGKADSARTDANKADSVAGSVTLAPALSQSANPDDIVFIFARAADGPGMPLAVTRVKVGELPYQFRLDDSMAMTQARKISDFEQLVVGARVSTSGSAARSSGDLEGFSEIITAGAKDVRVVIDQRVP